MKKVLYMHVGTPKTGTSALQQFFLQNMEILKKYNIYYPRGIGGNVTEITLSNDSLEEKAAQIDRMFGENENMLISCEAIWVIYHNNKQFFKALCDLGITVKVIVYLRKQEEYLESMIRQKTKEGFWFTKQKDWANLNIENEQDVKFVKRVMNEMHYLNGLNSMADVIGKENVIVKVYEKEQMKDNNIFSDFLQILGIEMTAEFTKPKQAINPSLDDSMLEIKRMMNEVAKGKLGEKELQKMSLASLLEVASFKDNKVSNSLQFSRQQIDLIRNQYADENEEIAKTFLNRQDGILFHYKDKESVKDKNADISDRELLEDTIRVMFNMLLNMQKRIGDLERGAETNCQQISAENTLKAENAHLNQLLMDKQNEIEAMKGGVSWKITAPLRKVRRLIKRKIAK